MLRYLVRAFPLLLALLFTAAVVIRGTDTGNGPVCVIVLIGSVAWACEQIWKKVDTYEKRIRQLEEKLERQQTCE